MILYQTVPEIYDCTNDDDDDDAGVPRSSHKDKTPNGAHHNVWVGEMPHRLIRKRCRYSSREKFEDAFDTALDLMQTKPSGAVFLAVFRTSINADQKQLVASYSV